MRLSGVGRGRSPVTAAEHLVSQVVPRTRAAVGAVRSGQIKYSILKAGLSYFLEGLEMMYKGREESRIIFHA